MTAQPTRLLCVDDHELLVEGFRSRLAQESDIEVVGQLGSAAGLLEAVRQTRAQIVLLDVEMPGPDSFEVLAELTRRHPEVRTIILSAFVRDGYIDAAFKAGAWGYVSKGDDPDHVVEAIRGVVRGEFAFGPKVLARCQGTPGVRDVSRPSSKLDLLTPREHQMLRMIGNGMSRGEIARNIHRSPKTVDNHRASIMAKLGIHDRVDLVRYAISEGLSDV